MSVDLRFNRHLKASPSFGGQIAGAGGTPRLSPGPGRVKIAHSRRPIARRYRLVSHGGTPVVSLNDQRVCGTVRRGLEFGKPQITKSELCRHENKI